MAFFISFVSGISTITLLLFVGKAFHDYDQGEWRGTDITLQSDQDAAEGLAQTQSFYLYILVPSNYGFLFLPK